MDSDNMVRMGELVVLSKSNSTLTALGLGSCIGICAYDACAKVAGMAHVVLPIATDRGNSLPAKSADLGVPNLIDSMVRAGADKRRIKIAIAGGAQIFAFKKTDDGTAVGDRNAAAVKSMLTSLGIRVLASDIGGSTGRTVKFCASTGTVVVRRVGDQEKVLAELG